ncbi:unnamed protein product [Rotaria magnacalcarata]|uniref:Uncharacterized protein n=8 Tax=Rotaria magnacalcarata TaxID=392030 RepID=A0A814MP47_9BILA|nr:unnamed protein product [Rotaria magnacalcarata]
MDSNRTEPVTTTTSSSSSNNEQQGYQSITLRSNDFKRYSYLSIFPPKTSVITPGVYDHLLLANVPNSRLGPDELRRRQQTSSTTTDASASINYDHDRDPFCLSSEDAKELSTRLQNNADRLSSICYLLLGVHQLFRRKVLERPDAAVKNPTLNSKQMSILLEFFLQIDVDVFYMKTCRFRGAEPCSTMQGLFCNDELPQARYSMAPCRTNDCQYCHSMENQNQNPSRSAAIDFENSSQHRFVNGYTTYLNCPATCTTSNIVYVMTCPCGQYEFTDSTSATLVDALRRMLTKNTKTIVDHS